MDKLKTKLRQASYRLKKVYLTLDNVVLTVALILCASWVWASIATMSRNWELEQKLEAKQLELAKLKLEVEKLALEKEYYLTAEYQELMARAKHNKMLEGETMVLLPQNSKAAKEKYAVASTEVITEESNFDSWMNFLFPRT